MHAYVCPHIRSPTHRYSIHWHGYIHNSTHTYIHNGTHITSTMAHAVHTFTMAHVHTYTYTCNRHNIHKCLFVCTPHFTVPVNMYTCALYDRYSCRQCVGTLDAFQRYTTTTCVGGFRGLRGSNPLHAMQTQGHPCGCTSCDAHTVERTAHSTLHQIAHARPAR